MWPWVWRLGAGELDLLGMVEATPGDPYWSWDSDRLATTCQSGRSLSKNTPKKFHQKILAKNLNKCKAGSWK